MPDEPQNSETMADLKNKLALAALASDERVISDRRYALKITETIVFGALILFALAALFFIFTKVGLPTPSLP